ncbi:hypothetical protein [Halorubrum kocurii]|uniref:hypothetical protein n=1 Tax=Halorubrum kocurii TaxID=478441 RepID=UPI0006777FD3|nr:hypothetical protein [Halorubrum kocurii]
MKLNEYLIDKESASVEVGASRSAEQVRSGGSGTLACTPYRLVYVDGNDVTDISLKGVNSIQYRGMEYPKSYLVSGVGATIFGLFVALVMRGASGVEPIPEGAVWGVAALSIAAGILTLVWGLFIRRASLKVHTPNKTYRFFSTDSSLKEIGHAVRGHEMKN